MIKFEGLGKDFGSFVAVQGLDICIPSGSVFAYLGPNGAGKTTTLKMTVGLMRPDRGRATINGFDMHVEALKAKKIMGYVPDEPHLYEKLTGREFLEMVARLYDMEVADARRQSELWIERFDMKEFIDQLAEGYSHGMRQRVVFSAALVHRPKVLVVDEPMVGLDPLNARRVKDILREFAQNGGAVLLSTHAMAVAQEVADTVGILNHGVIKAMGDLGSIRGDSSLEDVFLQMTADESAAQEL